MSVATDLPSAPNARRLESSGAWWSGLRSLLSRTTSSGRLIPAIDGLRSLAILAVIMHHLGGYVASRTPNLDFQTARQTMAYRVINVGNCGVQLFFVISGFILGLPFAEQFLCGGKPIRLGNYFTRRIRRLHPPYVINLLILSLLMIAVKHEAWSDIGPHLLASSLYLHNVLYQSMSTVNGVAWSLEIEVQFYLLAPLLAMAYAIPYAFWRRSLFCVAAAVVILWKSSAGHVVPYPMSGCVLYYLDYFLCGMVLADWHLSATSRLESTWLDGSLWDAIGGLSALACLAIILTNGIEFLLPAALLPACAAVLYGSRLNRFLSMPFFVSMGGMCYTTYLYHFGIISLVARFVAPWTTGWAYQPALALQAAIVLPSIMCVSSVLFLLIEKPFMLRPTTTATAGQ